MIDKYKKLLGSIDLIEPPKGLGKQIMTRIALEERRLIRIKALIFGTSTAVSFGMSAWAIVYLVNSVKESGFWNYLSLLFSGDGAVYAYWKELSFSLAESLPVLSFIVFFAAIGFFIWSFAKITALPAERKRIFGFQY